tara:strand:- start:90 stop:920 length:831 start_codon:yes stop_codon:yes gene_type:complete
MEDKSKDFKMKKFNLKNQFALITGASGLLGYEHAKALLEVNANIIITDIKMKTLEKNLKKLKKSYPLKNIIKQRLDVTKESSVLRCKKYLDKKGIFVSILVNNAAFNPSNEKLKSKLFENYNLKSWRKEIDVGLTGAFICSKVFGSGMAKKNKGVILNISSDLSVISPDHRLYNKGSKINNAKPVTYSVAKTGLIGLTRYLATYWSNKNIRCNAISPGGVYNDHNKNFVSKIKKLIPMGRMAKKDEYRSAVQFLCSDASSYLTGQNLVIDGGRSVW